MPRQPLRHVDDPVAAGRRIRDAREFAGLSQRGLAFPGCSPAYISRCENGARTPSLQVLTELARRVGSTAEWLAHGDGPEAAVTLVLAAPLLERKMRDWTRRGDDDGLGLADLTLDEREWFVADLHRQAVLAAGPLAQSVALVRAEHEQIRPGPRCPDCKQPWDLGPGTNCPSCGLAHSALEDAAAWLAEHR